MSGRHRRDGEPLDPGATDAPPAEAERDQAPPESAPPAAPTAPATPPTAEGERVGRRRAPGAPDTGPIPVVRDGEPAAPYAGGRRRRGNEAPGPQQAPPAAAPGSVTSSPVAAAAPPPASPSPVARRDPAHAPTPGLAPRDTPVSRVQPPVAPATPPSSAPATPPSSAPARPPASAPASRPAAAATMPRTDPRPPEAGPVGHRAADPRPDESRPTGARQAETREPEARAAEPDAPLAAPTAAAATTVMTSARRAEQRERERRAQQRNKLLLVGGAALVLLLVAGFLIWHFASGGSSGKGTTAGAKQQTLLLQLAGADKQAIDSALIGVTNPTSAAAVVLVPPRLVSDVPGAGTMPFGQAASLADRTASSKALTDLTGVEVQQSFTLDQAALTALVDKLGGVDLDVDTDVTSRAANGTTTVVVHAGQQHLTGAQAYAYATFTTGATEPDAARLSRFNDTLRGILAKLPKTQSDVQTLLGALDGASGQPVAAAAGVLSTLAAVEAAGSVAYDTLPVRDIDTGASTPTYGLDATAADALMKTRFAGSLVGGGSNALRVLVENGVGTPGLADKARSKLVDAGMRFVNGGNATQFGFTQTVVLIPDTSSDNQAKGEQVAKALGVPVADVQTSPRGQTVADVIVILGKDFSP